MRHTFRRCSVALVLAFVRCNGPESLVGADASSTRDQGGLDAARSDGLGGLTDLVGVDASIGDLAGTEGQDLAVGPTDLLPSGVAYDPLAITANKNESNFIGDEYAWIDADGLPRSILLTHNSQKDPANHWGGVARRITYQHEGATRACVGNLNAHPGFGKIISHYASTSTGSNVQGTHTRVLGGRHHAIHEYKWNVSFGGSTAAVTVHWFFANGRSHPVYAVTYDTTAAGANVINGDSRSPYGDIQWDYGSNANVEGVGWGDHYKFTSVGDPVCKKITDGGVCNCSIGGEGNGTCWTWDGWDYSQPNIVPYSMEWSDSVDAEMGLVQTQTHSQHESGGYWFYGNWEKTSMGAPFPEDYNWAYQLNQYELPYNGGIKSKRLSWGMNVGAVGQNSYNVIGSETGGGDGYPYQSYSTYVVLAAHSRAMVAGQLEDVESVQNVALTASTGSVRQQGPAGAGRTDLTTYAPVGWNPVYGTWELDADSDAVAMSLSLASGTLANPVFVLHNFGATTLVVSLDGNTLVPDVDYLATIDADRSTAWVTLRRSLTGTHAMAMHP